MADSQMVNFRVVANDLRRIDSVAKKLGMTRSDFIRQAVTEHVGRYTGDETVVAPKAGRGKAKTAEPTSKGLFPDCPRNSACSFQRLPTGVKLCTLCGVKKA